MKKSVIVVGGGIVGLSTAFYLRAEGHEVTLLDKGTITEGASFVNAGYLTPSHIVPLAAPGMISKGLKWMLNSSSPFYIKPRLDADLISWGWKFMRSCSKNHVQRSLAAIKEINELSKGLYHEMHASVDFDFHLEDRGVLMAFKTSKAEKSEYSVMQAAQDLGLDVSLLGVEEVNRLQPGIQMNIAGAYHYRCDAHSTPEVFMNQLKKNTLKSGVEIHTETTVKNFQVRGDRISTVVTDRGNFEADEVVFAAGAWTEELLKPLQIILSVQAGKGYRINVEARTGISLPCILMESKVGVTPMKGFTRFAGTMEIAGINHNIRENRVNAIAHAATQYYSGLEIDLNDRKQAKCGLRPLSPDGLPFIGRHSSCSNLVLATGHSMMGWSLGPATGKLVTEIISNKKLSMPIGKFSPERKYGR
ncbi:MAG: FAD-dependent oxidoreductase [Flavobacteriaceae bacterium]|nr:FAD-dependent oxidoreductase [Flavobacteriaceae bacterium]